ncbi:MAG: hypothetical protein NTV01_22440 [Bacteroidia bacterium]|nr:hypothetical protein [Bacteroidia bacterium]
MNPYLNNKAILDLVMRWKFHLGTIALISCIISIVLSSPILLKPTFKSTSTIYPVNMGKYSEESYTEQMLEVLESGDIRDKMIAAFKLDEHYKISPQKKYYKSFLYKKYSAMVSFRKTENEAVVIRVLDTDPLLASAMCDSLEKFYNKKIQSLHRIKWAEEFNIRNLELQRWKNRMDSIISCLSELGRKYGVMEISGQAEGISSAYFAAVANGKDNETLKEYFTNVASKSPEARSLMLRVEGGSKMVVETLEKREEAVRELTKDITYCAVVTKPYPADKKDRPKRSVIVLMSVFITLLMAMIVIGVIENRNDIKSL